MPAWEVTSSEHIDNLPVITASQMCFWASSSVTQPELRRGSVKTWLWFCDWRKKKKKKKVPARWQVSKISTYLLCVSSSVKSGSYQVLSAQCLQEPFTSKSTWRLTTKGPWSRDERRKSSDCSEETSHTHLHTAQRRWHVHLVYCTDWTACMWTCFSICM